MCICDDLEYATQPIDSVADVICHQLGYSSADYYYYYEYSYVLCNMNMGVYIKIDIILVIVSTVGCMMGIVPL